MDYTLLLIGGLLIGFMGVVFEGTLFISIPFWQYLFPTFNYGQLLGNIKMGSVTRGIASTITTWKKLEIKKILFLAIPYTIFSTLGSIFIAQLDQKYLIIAVIFAIAFCELSPRIAHLINKKTRFVFAVILGLYTGFISAGISLLLVALLRTTFPKDEDIIFVKIQARFIETLGHLVSVITLIFYANIFYPLWLYWAIGMFLGGYIGGIVLKKATKISARLQRVYLIIAYLIALLPLIIKLLN